MELSETIKKNNIIEQINVQNETFPRVYSPSSIGNSSICLQQIFIKNSQKIVSQLKNFGVLVFRDFDLQGVNQAVSLLKKLGLEDSINLKNQNQLEMVVGTKKQNFLNTEPLSMFQCPKMSKQQEINRHNQFFRLNSFGQYVSLFCLKRQKVANIGFMKWPQVLDYVKQKHPDLIKKIEKKGIYQIQVLTQNQNPQLKEKNGWKNSFQVASKEEAQKIFKQKKYQFQWLKNNENSCRLKKKTQTQNFKNIEQKISFQLNQILYFYKLSKKKQLKISDYITFGDNQQIQPSILQDIYYFSQLHTANFELKNGDLVILDNKIIKFYQQFIQQPPQVRKLYISLLNLSKNKVSSSLIQTLHTGYTMPLIGFGTWKIQKQDAAEVVYNAIKCGYRHIDCASTYQNEVQVGQGINRALKQKIVERKDLFITSKLWNTYHSPEHVREACQRTLKDLNLQYLDLYLMHFPVSLKFVPFEKKYPTAWIYPDSCMIEQKVPVITTWKAMQDLVQVGLVKNIGISNFTVALMRQLIYTCQIKPAVHQTQIHPQLIEQKLVKYARQQGVQVTSYSSFGASSYVPIGMAKQNQPIYKIQTIQNFAKKYNKTAFQIILRWVIQRGIAIIPKSVKVERMKQNFEVSQFDLSSQDMQTISNLNKNKRYNDPGDFCFWFGCFYPIHE